MELAASHKTVFVRDYLYRLIRRAGEEPRRLPNENDIAETCSVSRITVRRSIKELEDHQYIIRLPGRRGVFSNPENGFYDAYTIALLIGDGTGHNLDVANSCTLQAFLPELNDLFCSYEIAQLSSEYMDKPELFAKLEYDALIWFGPAPKRFPFFEALAESGFPAIALPRYSYIDMPYPKMNTILQDIPLIAENWLKEVTGAGKHNIIHIGESPAIHECLRKLSGRYGVKLHQERLIATPSDILKELPGLLRKHPEINAILCDGPTPRYRALAQVLHSSARTDMNIYIENAAAEYAFRDQYPELKIVIHSGFLNRFKFAGKTAGIQMKKLLSGHPGPFRNIVFKTPSKN